MPYKGNAPLLQDIGGGQVDFAVLVYSAAMGALAEQGRLKVIGQLGAQRSELLKNVPAASEGQALKNFSYKIWTGFMVPKNTPEDVVVRLHAAIGKTLQDPAVRAQLAAQTQVAVGADDAGRVGEVLRGRDGALPRHRQADQPAAAVSARRDLPAAALQARAGEFISLRRDIHRHPELAFEEHRTAALVADKLEGWGYAVERGIGGTGVVGTLVRGHGTRRLGLRADMDALPIARGQRRRLGQRARRRDARLRPRRPHRDAAGRGAPPGRAGRASTARCT